MKTLNNRSGASHNIINHKDNKFSGSVDAGSINNRCLANRKKGLAEFNDLQRPQAPTSNPSHNNALLKNAGVFKRKDGEFTHLYDSAARFGDNKPF